MRTPPDHGLGLFSGRFGNLVNVAVGTPKPRPPRGPNTGLGGLGGLRPFPGGLSGAFGGGKKAGAANRA